MKRILSNAYLVTGGSKLYYLLAITHLDLGNPFEMPSLQAYIWFFERPKHNKAKKQNPAL